MFNYHFPASPFTVDLKELRGEYDDTPQAEYQPRNPARSGWRVSLAAKLQTWAKRLAPLNRMCRPKEISRPLPQGALSGKQSKVSYTCAADFTLYHGIYVNLLRRTGWTH